MQWLVARMEVIEILSFSLHLYSRSVNTDVLFIKLFFIKRNRGIFFRFQSL